MTWPKMRDIIKHIEEDSMEGWCTNCRAWTHDCCEPDAHEYECPECGKNTVFAAEEILINIA
jgi:Zn finger protein HypA/HybF involved in hydrogenase expression